MATSTSQVELGFAADSETAQRINKLADLTVDDISKIYNLGEELGRYNFSLGFLCHL